MPWIVAAYIVMLVLVPFDSVAPAVGLPIEATVDRIAILILAATAFLIVTTSGRTGFGWPRLGMLGAGMFALVGVALLSILANATVLDYAGELPVAVKRVALLTSYAAFLVLVAMAVLPPDVRGLVQLLIGVGCLCALGVIYQYRADVNVFFDITRRLLGGVLEVEPTPEPQYAFSRRVITGPTRHGLAVTAMLAMIAPLALALALQARTSRARLGHAIAFALIMIGAISTLRRTSIVAPLAVLAVFVAYRPRQLLPLMPFLVAGYPLLRLLAPGAGGSLLGQLRGTNSLAEASNQGRVEDYVAIHLDVLHRPLIGRGYGAYQPESYRILDNQYLLLLIEVGLVGIVCFTVVLAGAWLGAHRVQRDSQGWTRWFGVAAVAATAVFAVVSAIFDTLSFPQPAYVFMLVAAFVTVLGAHGPLAPEVIVGASVARPDLLPPAVVGPDRTTPVAPTVTTGSGHRLRWLVGVLALLLIWSRRRR